MATWKKLVLSGSNISQLNNDAGYITSVATQDAFTTASFGSTKLLAGGAQGDLKFTSGSGGQAGVLITANAGTDTLDFSLGAASVPNTALVNSTISGIALGSDLANLTVDDETLNLDSGTTYNGGTAKIISIKDDGVDTDAIAHSLGTLGTHQFTGSFTGSFKGDVDIDLLDLTAGNGLVSDTGNPYDGNAATTFSVQADSATGGNIQAASVTGNGVGIDISAIAGNGLSADGSANLDVGVDDSTIEINGSDNLQVKNDGIGTDQIAHSLGTLGTHQFTGSFSGSFVGDGSGLTGIGGTLTVDGDSGTENVTLTTDDLQIITDDANEIFTAVTKDGTDVKVKIGLPDNVVIGNDLTVTNDLTVNRDLTVAGTASFQHTTNLEVVDRFIRLASGSNAAGDGGFVVQQASNGTGDVFGFDGNATSRWGVAQNFDGKESVFTPAAFMASVVVGAGNDPDATAARYDQKGNIFIGTDENIWIYS